MKSINLQLSCSPIYFSTVIIKKFTTAKIYNSMLKQESSFFT